MEDKIIVSSFEAKNDFNEFFGIKQTTGAKNRCFSQIVESIKTSAFFCKNIEFMRGQIDKKTFSALKEKLPYFTPSGTFAVRNESGLTQYSGLVHIDIDNLDTNEIVTVKKNLLAYFNDFVFCMFVSPSGCGLKVFFKVFGDVKTHKIVFDDLQKEFARLNTKIDSGCKDVPRACFYSYDPNIYYNPDSDPIYPNTMSAREILEDLIKGVEKKGYSFSGGGRNQFVFYVACACNRYGLDVEEVKTKLFASFERSDFDRAEIEKCVKNGYKNLAENGKQTWKTHTTQNTPETTTVPATKAEVMAKIKQKHTEIVQKNAELSVLLQQLEQLSK